ncbi:MAG: hypothetical protein NTW08_07100 [Gammaproteobacteria bacterium]|nr:hypothetical protein [Gammaproteobacteria bacterium]
MPSPFMHNWWNPPRTLISVFKDVTKLYPVGWQKQCGNQIPFCHRLLIISPFENGESAFVEYRGIHTVVDAGKRILPVCLAASYYQFDPVSYTRAQLDVLVNGDDAAVLALLGDLKPRYERVELFDVQQAIYISELLPGKDDLKFFYPDRIEQITHYFSTLGSGLVLSTQRDDGVFLPTLTLHESAGVRRCALFNEEQTPVTGMTFEMPMLRDSPYPHDIQIFSGEFNAISTNKSHYVLASGQQQRYSYLHPDDPNIPALRDAGFLAEIQAKNLFFKTETQYIERLIDGQLFDGKVTVSSCDADEEWTYQRGCAIGLLKRLDRLTADESVTQIAPISGHEYALRLTADGRVEGFVNGALSDDLLGFLELIRGSELYQYFTQHFPRQTVLQACQDASSVEPCPMAARPDSLLGACIGPFQDEVIDNPFDFRVVHRKPLFALIDLVYQDFQNKTLRNPLFDALRWFREFLQLTIEQGRLSRKQLLGETFKKGFPLLQGSLTQQQGKYVSAEEIKTLEEALVRPVFWVLERIALIYSFRREPLAERILSLLQRLPEDVNSALVAMEPCETEVRHALMNEGAHEMNALMLAEVVGLENSLRRGLSRVEEGDKKVLTTEQIRLRHMLTGLRAQQLGSKKEQAARKEAHAAFLEAQKRELSALVQEEETLRGEVGRTQAKDRNIVLKNYQTASAGLQPQQSRWVKYQQDLTALLNDSLATSAQQAQSEQTERKKLFNLYKKETKAVVEIEADSRVRDCLAADSLARAVIDGSETNERQEVFFAEQRGLFFLSEQVLRRQLYAEESSRQSIQKLVSCLPAVIVEADEELQPLWLALYRIRLMCFLTNRGIYFDSHSQQVLRREPVIARTLTRSGIDRQAVERDRLSPALRVSGPAWMFYLAAGVLDPAVIQREAHECFSSEWPRMVPVGDVLLRQVFCCEVFSQCKAHGIPIPDAMATCRASILNQLKTKLPCMTPTSRGLSAGSIQTFDEFMHTLREGALVYLQTLQAPVVAATQSYCAVK